MFAGRMTVAQPCEIGAAEIVHVVESYHIAHFGAEQCGVLLGYGYVIVDERYVHAAKAVNLGRRGDIEKVIGCASVLCRHAPCRPRYQQGRHGMTEYSGDSPHLRVQKYVHIFITAKELRYCVVRGFVSTLRDGVCARFLLCATVRFRASAATLPRGRCGSRAWNWRRWLSEPRHRRQRCCTGVPSPV